MASISRSVVKKVLSQETSEVFGPPLLLVCLLKGATGSRRTRSPLNRLFAAAELDPFPYARSFPYWQGRCALCFFCCPSQIPTPAYVQGFPDHPHRGQATVTYITQGESKHEDSAGHAGIIREGGVQWMCAVRLSRSHRRYELS